MHVIASFTGAVLNDTELSSACCSSISTIVLSHAD